MDLRSDIMPTVSDQQRRPYQRPCLQRFGSVKALTADGSGTDIEAGEPFNCSQNRNRRSCNGG